MKLTVLYPFMEDSFNDQTLAFIEEISWLQHSRKIDVLTVVDRIGQTSEALKKAKIPYTEIPFKRPVGTKDFYLTALFKLVTSSLPLFFYFREHKIDVMHCPDLLSLLCWGNTAKMNRVRFILSAGQVEKFSHYTSLMLADTAKIICRTEDVRAKIPPAFSARSVLAPTVQNADEKLNNQTVSRQTVDFWTELYASLCVRLDPRKITGLYK